MFLFLTCVGFSKKAKSIRVLPDDDDGDGDDDDQICRKKL